MRARRLPVVVALWGAMAAPACTITDVVTQQGDELLVVEAVLRTDVEQQRVLLHRTLTSGITGVERDARVVVRTSGSREILFQQAADASLCLDDGTSPDSAAAPVACYLSPRGEGWWVRPGEEYELTVTAAGGRRAFGRTRVPGAFQLLRPTGGAGVCRLPPGTPLPLVWSRSAGAWSYLADLEIRNLAEALSGQVPGEIPDPLNLQGLSISEADTTMTLPADFGVFQRTEFEQPLLRALQAGLPAGTTARLVVAAVDRNYVNAVRGGSFNPSGRVRVPSIAGDGTGFFGSLVPHSLTIEVRGEDATRPCLEG